LIVAGQLQQLCVCIFPANAPAMMCPFNVRDGPKARPIPCSILFLVPLPFSASSPG
jgi:hypothetical protein